jgi:hypothetical protein
MTRDGTSYVVSIVFTFACGSALMMSVAIAFNRRWAAHRPALIVWSTGLVIAVAYTVAYICAMEKADFVLRSHGNGGSAPCPPYHTQDKHGMCLIQDVGVETEAGEARLDPDALAPLTAAMGGRIRPTRIGDRGSRRVCCAANAVPYSDLSIRCASSERLRCE